MREAIVHLDDRQVAAIGLDELLPAARAAGLEQLTLFSREGAGRVFQLHVREPIPPEDLDRVDAVVWWECLRSSATGVTYLWKVDPPGDADLAAAARGDATADDDSRERTEVAVVGPADQLGESLETIEPSDADVLVERLCNYHASTAPMDALTDRQREVLRTAHRMGYYDVPRTATSEEVAREVGLDPSTVVEHLQRAERNIMDRLVR